METTVPGKTQWEDALIRNKVIEPKKVFTEEEIIDIASNVIENKQSNYNLKEKSQHDGDEDDEIEDGDDEFFEQYREKMYQEMLKSQNTNKLPYFGNVIELSAPDFKPEVTNADPNIWVIVHLFQEWVPLCTMVNNFLESLASMHPHVKFIKMVATRCIPNFPDSQLPCVFVYKAGKVIKNNLECIKKAKGQSSQKLTLNTLDTELKDLFEGKEDKSSTAGMDNIMENPFGVNRYN